MSGLPEYCVPNSELLVTISKLFGTCIPSTQSLASTTFGILSIAAWLCAQIPQVWKNYRRGSVEGLSWMFLGIWLMGDFCNLFGALWTGQMWFQYSLATYYVFIDLILVGQFVYYAKYQTLSTEDAIDGISIANSSDDSSSSGDEDSKKKRRGSKGKGRKVRSLGHTMIVLVGLCFTLAGALPVEDTPTRRLISPFFPGGFTLGAPRVAGSEGITLAQIGGVLSWISTGFYLTSRLPQILLNAQRRSTDGVAIYLFVAAFFGNFFYSASLLSNPLGWFDYAAHGGGGIAGPEGSDAEEWWGRTLPFFLGSAGVLAMDAVVGWQFLLWGEGAKVVEVGEERGWWWQREGLEKRRSDSQEERRGLLHGEGEGYGGM
ncbi:hypothetical protein RUND412_009653 [Rhizina undulata]